VPTPFPRSSGLYRSLVSFSVALQGELAKVEILDSPSLTQRTFRRIFCTPRREFSSSSQRSERADLLPQEFFSCVRLVAAGPTLFTKLCCSDLVTKEAHAPRTKRFQFSVTLCTLLSFSLSAFPPLSCLLPVPDPLRRLFGHPPACTLGCPLHHASYPV